MAYWNGTTFLGDDYDFYSDLNAHQVAPEYSSSATYAVGDYCIYDAVLYRCTTAITTVEAWTAAHWSEVKLGQEVTNLKEDLTQLEADMENGNFPEMAVGSADQLISDNYVVESEPYQFRKSGGSANVGTRMEDCIVGGSIVWNQLIRPNTTYPQNGISASVDNDGIWTLSGTSTTFYSNITSQVDINEFNAGQKFFMSFKEIANPNNIPIKWGLLNGSFTVGSILIGTETIAGVSSISGINTGITNYNSETDFTGVKFKLICCSLTKMFGSTIADYIYSLEQANQGDGVAWFKKLFPKDYYAYNAGELKHVSGLSEHKTVGVNIWDEEWELGTYDASDGSKYPVSNSTRSKNKIRVTPNTTYYFKTGTTVYKNLYFYDLDEKFISYSASDTNTTFITPNNCHYITFALNSSYGTTYNHDICINLSDPTKNGTYEPYDGHSYALDDSLTLRGIPKLDSNNRLYFDGDKYLASGVVQRRYGIVDLGSLNWGVGEASSFGYAMLSNPKRGTTNIILSPSMPSEITQYRINDNNDAFVVYFSAGAYDSATLKTAMLGVYLVYELATPTTEEAEPYHNPQILSPEGTEEYITTSLVPVGHETKYFEDLKGKIEGLPANFATLIADTEKTFKATKNYSQGDYLIVNNQLYKVSSAITSGSTITPNTNVTATTIMAEILALA